MFTKNGKCFVVLAIAALMLSGAAAQGATITYNYANGAVDACAISWSNTYQCTIQEDYLGVGNLDNGGTPFTHAAVLKADLSSMPAYASINSVTFKLYCARS